eukprot:TRINITY_DN11508_c0_g1_i1.p2 TRINITY_DN11508_c0_g1~~TRINITY_DN11508_c0_g1_i1.p2  ORF type:complete len:148 (+),score=68.87 TRINITY_DN11508_c0_g1_i1:26-469(+)
MTDDIDPGYSLCASARTGNVNYMKRVYSDHGKDLNINFQDGTGNTALHYCAQQNQYDAAVMLLEWGANTNIRNLQGDTPLHLASRRNKIQMIELLIAKGADRSLQNKKNVSAVHETRSEEAKKLIKFSLREDDIDPSMLADADDCDG